MEAERAHALSPCSILICLGLWVDLRAVADYRGVNEAVWNYFVKAYGGGPALPRPVLDIYATPVVKAAAPPPAPPAPDTAMSVDTTTAPPVVNGHAAPLSEDGEDGPQDPDATGGNDTMDAPAAPAGSTNGTPTESSSAAAASKKKKKKKKTRATSESAVSDAGDDAQSDAA